MNRVTFWQIMWLVMFCCWAAMAHLFYLRGKIIKSYRESHSRLIGVIMKRDRRN